MPKPQRFAIVEQPRRAAGELLPNGKRKISEIEGEFIYILFKLGRYRVLDNSAVFKGYFSSLEEAQAKAPPGVAVIRYKKENK